MKLDCYQTDVFAPKMVPGRLNRDWMDQMPDRHAYRCLPLNMANVSGWELLCNQGFEIEWNGGPGVEDIQIIPDHPDRHINHLVSSHFSHGIFTFHTGYLFRTPKDWSMWAMGPPNRPKDGVSPLSGLVETDWLPYPFTMNWRFTAPCRVRFEEDEPFCFVTVIEYGALDEIVPRIHQMDDNPELKAEYETWREARSEFNKRIDANDPVAIREAWQKFYMKGRTPDNKVAEQHRNKRRLAAPVSGEDAPEPKAPDREASLFIERLEDED